MVNRAENDIYTVRTIDTHHRRYAENADTVSDQPSTTGGSLVVVGRLSPSSVTDNSTPSSTVAAGLVDVDRLSSPTIAAGSTPSTIRRSLIIGQFLSIAVDLASSIAAIAGCSATTRGGSSIVGYWHSPSIAVGPEPSATVAAGFSPSTTGGSLASDRSSSLTIAGFASTTHGGGRVVGPRRSSTFVGSRCSSAIGATDRSTTTTVAGGDPSRATAHLRLGVGGPHITVVATYRLC